jgi:branched-chain amino acid transport system permease protein
MEQVVLTLTNILVLSSMYILVALGFVLLFNVAGILNFAHGAIYMLGGYLGFAFSVVCGLNQWLGLLLTVLVIASFGLLLEKFCFRPFAGDFNRTVTICIAIIVILETGVNIIGGTRILTFPAFIEGILRIGHISVSYERIITFVIGIALLGIIIWFIKRTKWGQQMQAISQDMEAAALQGINVHRISALASALGCGLAAIAGCLMGAYIGLGPFMGDFMLVKVLIVAILAGVGSIGGVFFAGLVLGVIDAALPMFISGAASSAIAVAIVIVILLIRPQGFFGHEMEM